MTRRPLAPLPLLLALALAPALAVGQAPAVPGPDQAGPETPLRLAARLAARQVPTARWRLAEARTTDLTLDGVPDLALLGVDGAAFVLAVVEGPLTERSRVLTLRFAAGEPAGHETPDALCGPAAAVQANTERPDPSRLPGLDAATRERIEDGADAGALGLVLVHARATGYCPGVHVLFDGARLAWWRAAPTP